MNGQLTAVTSDLESARARVRELRLRLPRQAWVRRPGPDRWSAADCLAHLNLSSAAVVPCVREAVNRARALRAPGGMRYQQDAMGWLLGTLVSPGSPLKLTAPRAFTPCGGDTVDGLVARFDQLQAELIALVREADGLPIDRVDVVSPFDARVTVNLYAALRLVPRHQHRHLLQAVRAAEAPVPVLLLASA